MDLFALSLVLQLQTESFQLVTRKRERKVVGGALEEAKVKSSEDDELDGRAGHLPVSNILDRGVCVCVCVYVCVCVCVRVRVCMHMCMCCTVSVIYIQ